jgi:hypothetical protein
MTVDHREAARITESALGRVFDSEVVRRLREDSPLSVLGMVPADAVCVADAVATVADESGLACELDDADLADVLTVADLVRAVARAAEPGGAQ